MTNELFEKAKKCQSSEELLELAKANGVDLTEEQAAQYYDQMHQEGELSDDELDSAAGGGCYTSDGYLKTIAGYSCEHYEERCQSGIEGTCGRCKWWGSDPGKMVFIGQTFPCKHPSNKQ